MWFNFWATLMSQRWQELFDNDERMIEKVQLEFEIRIKFCAMCLNLCKDHTIIIHLSFLLFVPSELMSKKY